MYINDQNHSSSDSHNPTKKSPNPPFPTKLSFPPTWGGHPSIPLKTIWRIM